MSNIHKAKRNDVRNFVATAVTSMLAGDFDNYDFDKFEFEYYCRNEGEFIIYANDEMFLVKVSKPRLSKNIQGGQ